MLFAADIYTYSLFIVVLGLNSMAELVAETATMKLFDHSNVLQLLGVCVDTNNDDMLRAVLPYMANGDLRNFLKRKRANPANNTEYANVCCFFIPMYNLKKLCMSINYIDYILHIYCTVLYVHK